MRLLRLVGIVVLMSACHGVVLDTEDAPHAAAPSPAIDDGGGEAAHPGEASLGDGSANSDAEAGPIDAEADAGLAADAHPGCTRPVQAPICYPAGGGPVSAPFDPVACGVGGALSDSCLALCLSWFYDGGDARYVCIAAPGDAGPSGLVVCSCSFP